MLYSMTGFGKAICNFDILKISIEVKTLNSKQLDVNCKIPFDFREKEYQIRNKLSSELLRGKIDCIFVQEQNNAEGLSQINIPLFESYFRKIIELANNNTLEISDRLMLAALKMPDVISNPKIELNEKNWGILEKGLNEAIEQCKAFRLQEGAMLENDLKTRANKILELLKNIHIFELERIKNIRSRINENLNEFLEKKNIDENRFEQEMIYYIEKIDISEEKTRLENHCRYFLETINDTTEAGKKLNFISQEMGREINTLGSKANNADIQRIVVEMKDELEKIKEQVLNIV